MALIVQKYGGSSLANAEAIRNVAQRVTEAIRKEDQIIVVVSAMGDTTNELRSLAQDVSGKIDPRELDILLSTGELISCTLISMALQSQGLNAISLSGGQAGILTDSSYGKARIASVNPARILKELSNGKTVVVAGFQGMTDHMDTTTLGRGASDLSAVAIAAGLKAKQCEVYTDVDGIYTADPKIVPRARILRELSYEEMLEMASYGAKMNPRAIELAMVYGIRIIVASSFANTPGTLIYEGADMETEVGEIRNRVRAITTDTNVAKISLLQVVDQPGIAAKLFEPLSDANVSVDVIVQNASVGGSTDLTFTVEHTDLDGALQIIGPVAKKMAPGGIKSADDLGKVSIVGTGMQDAPGYASKMFRSLAEAKINIDMITTSEIRITCVIDRNRLEDAARVLHDAFELEQPN